MSTAIHHNSSALNDAARRASTFITRWTPFCLVLAYIIFSICLYMFISNAVFKVFWFVYLTTNFFTSSVTVVEAAMSMGPAREARKAVEKAKEADWVFPTPDDHLLILDLIIVAYLPNEKDIIVDRIYYALDNIVYPEDKIRINLLYNTPHAIEPLETEISELAMKHPRLRVIKVANSTSKADNLNHFLTLNTGAHLIAIFDSDHFTHPYGPRWAVERFLQDPKIDVVQGRCIIYNSASSFLSSMISVEFDKIYATSHPGRATLWRFGLFTGSNGYWRANLIRELKMDGSMLTEDIDSSLRANNLGKKIVHDPNVVSYELAPVKLVSLLRQRLRWTQGWTQVSIRHIPLAFTKSPAGSRDLTMRFGLFSLLFVREFSYYLVTQYTCLIASYVLLDFPTTPAELAKTVFFEYPLSQWLFIIGYVSHISKIIITLRVSGPFAYSTPIVQVASSALSS
jgi:cellulose synthase/poly-beta-1,6-N-acetylglucosamine synthase-like glycosyltransferase